VTAWHAILRGERRNMLGGGAALNAEVASSRCQRSRMLCSADVAHRGVAVAPHARAITVTCLVAVAVAHAVRFRIPFAAGPCSVARHPNACAGGRAAAPVTLTPIGRLRADVGARTLLPLDRKSTSFGFPLPLVLWARIVLAAMASRILCLLIDRALPRECLHAAS
jgi:hypothetical protein